MYHIIKDASVIQKLLHVIPTNANDVYNIAEVVDHVITIQDPKQFLQDSIHAPKQSAIIDLSSYDLRYKINSLHHRKHENHPGFAKNLAVTIPGISRLDKYWMIHNMI